MTTPDPNFAFEVVPKRGLAIWEVYRVGVVVEHPIGTFELILREGEGFLRSSDREHEICLGEFAPTEEDLSIMGHRIAVDWFTKRATIHVASKP